MADVIVGLRFFHGENFVRKRNGLEYIGFDVDEIHNFDIDCLSYPELWDIVEKDLKYNNVAKIYYRDGGVDDFEGSLKLVHNDSIIYELLQNGQTGDMFEFYIEHGVDEYELADVEGPLCIGWGDSEDDTGDMSGPNGGPTEHCEPCEGRDGNLSRKAREDNSKAENSSRVDSEIPVVADEDLLEDEGDINVETNDTRNADDGDNREATNEEDDATNEEDDDEDLVDVGIQAPTDNDEEELLTTRKNVREFKRRRKSQVHAVDKRSYTHRDNVNHKGTENDGEHQSFGGNDSTADGNGSEYFSSSDPGSFLESDEQSDPDVAARRRSKRRGYDRRSDAPVDWKIGLTFDSAQQFRAAIRKYGVASQRVLKFTKNEAHRVRVECDVEGCPWMVFASVERNNNTFVVKTVGGDHNCASNNINKLCNTDFLVTMLRERIKSHKGIKIWEIKAFCERELKVTVTFSMCRRVKRRVMMEIEGNHIEDYARLWDYAEELKLSNEGSTVSIKVSNDEVEGTVTFKSMYVCFGALKRGWKAGCRPIIGLDGCFLKGVCKGQLLCAIGRDCNDQMYPIAWAVVDMETKNTWSWFLTLLKSDLDLQEGDGLTLISDMQKVNQT